MSYDITITRNSPEVSTIHLQGNLEDASCEQFDAAVSEVLLCKPAFLIIDMGGLNYISSRGVRIILRARKEMMARQAGISLINLTAGVRKVFDIINDVSAFRLFSSQEELDRHLEMIQQRAREKGTDGA